MDRHTLRNILTIALISCDLVLTKEIIYKTLGSKVNLVCPIETTRDITWTGPPAYTIYAIGTDVSLHVSNILEINETFQDKKSVLFIHNFTEDLSGEFRCSDGVYEREFNLGIRRDPSDLTIVNAKGGKIITVEGREHNLVCMVTSGQPGGNITWSTYGAVVAINRPSMVSYRFIPQRSDNGNVLQCEAFNSQGESILESSVYLDVFYIPKITFRPKQTLTVNEGADAQLICINDGNVPNTTTVWKSQDKSTVITQNDKLKFIRIQRTDAGLYTCRVESKAGVYEDNAKIVVQYAPTVDIQYLSTERKIVCIPSGVPDRYTFLDWEHTTEYNDHIRFLKTTKEGEHSILTFPKYFTGKDRLRDRGIYICWASNNISSTDGIFVMRKYHLNLTGTPYFVSSTESTQYGVYLKTAMIQIKFVSVPEYNSYDVYKDGTNYTDFTESVYRNIKLSDNIYGKNVSVKGSVISLQIQIDSEDDFSSYNIVVKNAIGSSNHTLQLVSASAPSMPKIIQTVAKQTQIFVFWIPGFNGGFLQWFIVEYKESVDFYWKNQTTNLSNSTVIGGLKPATNYLIRMFARNMIADSYRTAEVAIQTDETVQTFLTTQSVVILSLMIIIVILVAGIVIYVRRLKHRYKERIVPGVNFQTPEETFGESAHYTEIIEDDNPEPTSQENANSTMSMTNRDLNLESAEHTSTSSDNNRDSSEYLDDGYEQPYTTLVVSDQVKDDHVYLTTKTKSDYENAILFQKVACGHACKNMKEDSLSDTTNAHDDQENWNLNYDVNDFNDTNDNVPQTYINPQMNKAEYVNLSLYQ